MDNVAQTKRDTVLELSKKYLNAEISQESDFEFKDLSGLSNSTYVVTARKPNEEA